MLASAEAATPIEVVSRFLDSAPVDLGAMAEALGLDVRYDAAMPADVSGSIRRVGERFRVEINGQHGKARQRFTLAHEIAHYVLHRDLIGDGITDNALYRSRLSNDLETQANRFAVEILMPARVLRSLYLRDGVRDLASLTSRFVASDAAMRIRLKSLGLAP